MAAVQNTPASVPAVKIFADKSGSKPGLAIGLMVLAVGLFAVMDAMVKWLGESYAMPQLMFFRGLFAFVPLFLFMFRGSLGNILRVNDPMGHLIRCLVGIFSLACFFYAFTHMPLADAVAIGFAAPVFVTALSVPLLGEKVGPRRWTAVLVGFIGVLIMVQPGGGSLDSVALIMLAGTLCYALAMILVRKLSRTETSASIVFYFTLTATLLSGAALPFYWVTPGLEDLLWLIGLGLVGGTAQIVITLAFRYADVALVMPFEYSAMIWAALFGFMFWGEVPGLNIWVGVTIVILSGLYILFREANLGLKRGVARKLHSKR